MDNNELVFTQEMEEKLRELLQNEEFMSKAAKSTSIEEVNELFNSVGIELDRDACQAFLEARSKVTEMDELPEELLECVNGGGKGLGALLGAAGLTFVTVAGIGLAALAAPTLALFAVGCGVAVGAGVVSGAVLGVLGKRV